MPVPAKPPKVLMLGVALALGLLGAGCGRLDRVMECRALARTVNPALDAIETSLAPKNGPAYRAASRGYAELAKTLRQQRFSTPLVQQLATEYTDFAAELAAALERYATTLSGDPAERPAALASVQLVIQREAALAARIGAHCNAR